MSVCGTSDSRRLRRGGRDDRRAEGGARPQEPGDLEVKAPAAPGDELQYHERLYDGFAQAHFSRPAVRALRAHMVSRILHLTGSGSTARVLSLGCGIGDTELLLAPWVREVVGVDFSPRAVEQANRDAAAAGVANARFLCGTPARVGLPEGCFDAVIGIFFLHHLPESELAEFPLQLKRFLAPGGVFYGLDPSRRRLSGRIGSLLFPRLMKKYQSPGERELDAKEVAAIFARHGFSCRLEMYDFVSSPLAGLLPGWRQGYRAARAVDEVLLRIPVLRDLGSNFELIARQ